MSHFVNFSVSSREAHTIKRKLDRCIEENQINGYSYTSSVNDKLSLVVVLHGTDETELVRATILVSAAANG